MRLDQEVQTFSDAASFFLFGILGERKEEKVMAGHLIWRSFVQIGMPKRAHDVRGTYE